MKSSSTSAGPDPWKIAKTPTEHAQQVAVFVWAAQQFQRWPELRLMFAIPNGGERNKIVAANLKAEGVRRHVPDIFLPVPRAYYHGLFIEMKKKGGHVDPGQADLHKKLIAKGYGAIVCWSFEEAIKIIENYLTYKA
jgi:hypothetical protein